MWWFLVLLVPGNATIYAIYHHQTNTILFTALQSLMNSKLCEQRFLPCNMNRIVKMIQTIPQNLYVSFKLTSVEVGLGLILVYPNPLQGKPDLKSYILDVLGVSLELSWRVQCSLSMSKTLVEFSNHHRLESCVFQFCVTLCVCSSDCCPSHDRIALLYTTGRKMFFFDRFEIRRRKCRIRVSVFGINVFSPFAQCFGCQMGAAASKQRRFSQKKHLFEVD